jgi:CheY-like chemotaxis protein
VRVPARVLVVEDDTDILSSLVEVIRDDGFEVLSAANGYQALAQLEAQPVDVIFLDLMMPVMDGWRFLHEVRARFPERRAHVVLLSAVRELTDEARKLGVERYLPKPFNLDEVVRLARELSAALHDRHAV